MLFLTDRVNFLYSCLYSAMLCICDQAVLIAHRCFSCHWTALAQSQGLSFFHSAPQASRWGVSRRLGGAQMGQMSQTDKVGCRAPQQTGKQFARALPCSGICWVPNSWRWVTDFWITSFALLCFFLSRKKHTDHQIVECGIYGESSMFTKHCYLKVPEKRHICNQAYC